MQSPKYLFIPSAAEIGAPFVTDDEPTSADEELATLGSLSIIRISELTRYCADHEGFWEPLPTNVKLPIVAALPRGVVVGAEEDPMHVHPSKA